MKKSPTGHPAPFSEQVLETFASLIPAGTRIHDPFAGDGVRLGMYADRCGWTFTGTELAAAFIADPRVRHGNSTKALTYPRKPGFVIVTSAVYPNGIADDFNAQDESTRRTYRSAQAKLLGHDEPLHPDNQGRWGYRGTPLSSPSRAMYWSIATRVVAKWTTASAAFVNVSDFMAGGQREPVVMGWSQVLLTHGWEIERTVPVKTPRYRNTTTKSSARVNVEHIIVAHPPKRR